MVYHAQKWTLDMRKWSLVIAVAVPFYLLVPCVSSRVVAQAVDSQASPTSVQPLPVPKPEQWQPDSLQRALVTGTTVPMDAPIPLIPGAVDQPFAPPLATEGSNQPGTTANSASPFLPAKPGGVSGKPAIAPSAVTPQTVTKPTAGPGTPLTAPDPTAVDPSPTPTQLDTGVPLEPDIAFPRNRTK